MYRPNSSNQSFFNNQPIPVEYSVPPVSHTDEELGIPQQRLLNSREMQEALRIEIEKEMRRCREIESQINKQVGATVSPPAPPFFAPPRDDEMSVEEILARDCKEKRLVEKAAAIRRRRYGG
ncbi:uncharacterized protein LOC132602071 isoform X1 [Lycium barbarum]|uniref:uncharacterized protein LOC132602071 isoform X1 n=1 Tax=Lycium barbarum TaxID=112863 RepID=UPI00293F6955|nr:uncharacterized protein LOC132602071 isoform X1 [Lycium barbarum]